MKTPPPDTSARLMLKHLPYFVAAAEEGSFQLAAERLYIVQSALSRRIAELESELGVRLFERLHQGVRLTPSGAMLLEDARCILADVERVRRRVQLFDSGDFATLRVGFNSGSMLQPAIIHALRLFRSRYPGIELRLMPMLSEAQFDALAAGRIDVGFAYDLDNCRTVERRELLLDELILAMPDFHPLAGDPVISLSALKDCDFIWAERALASRMSELALAQFKAGGVTPRIVMEAGSTESTLSLVSAGMGLALINRSQQGRQPRNVLLRSITDFYLPMPLRLIWSSGERSPALLRFVDVMSATIDDLAEPSKNPAPASNLNV